MTNPNDPANSCITKREFFAAFALIGSAKSPQQALEAADKLIRELNK